MFYTRAILTAKNVDVDKFNSLITKDFPGKSYFILLEFHYYYNLKKLNNKKEKKNLTYPLI